MSFFFRKKDKQSIFLATSTAFILFLVSAGSTAQIVANADAVTTQANINRDEKGFKSCGVRVVTAILDQKTGSMAYDFSVNLWKDALGMMKAGQQSIPFNKSKGWDVSKLKVRTPGPESFWLAKRDEGLTLKPEKYTKADDPGYVLGGADGSVAVRMIWAITTGEAMQIALRYPSDKYDKIIAFKANMSDEDRSTVQSCLAGMADRMKQEGFPAK